ncbi:MAG: ABC transporter permease, partial [Rhodobacteraceae bacterium]|nr:ABC transporter permease [Paracoccaceae bacterium]
MEPLTWTGTLGGVLNPIFFTATAVFLVAVLAQIVLSVVTGGAQAQGDMFVATKGPADYAGMIVKWSFGVIVATILAYLIGGILVPGIEAKGIIGAISSRLLPVWIALVVVFAASIIFKRRLGLYGKLFDSPIGMIGFGMVMFWVFTGIFAAMDLIVTHDALTQVSGMKNKVPGTPLSGAEGADYPYYLLGGDNLARDVFSRMIYGAWEVLKIAPFATIFAFMVGITLGLPAGYYGGKLDTFLSFLANLVLAFPVILLFYLLVTPEIVLTGIPIYMAGVLFLFPIIFLTILFNSRFF